MPVAEMYYNVVVLQIQAYEIMIHLLTVVEQNFKNANKFAIKHNLLPSHHQFSLTEKGIATLKD